MHNKKIKLDLLKGKRILAGLLASGTILINGASVKAEEYTQLNYGVYSSSVEEELRFLSQIGMKVDLLYDGTLFLRSYVNKGITNLMAYSNDEFREYLSVRNPSFTDVREAIKNNEYICEYFKDWINEFVDRLESVNPNIDLAVFYYNLCCLNIGEITREEMDVIGTNAVARFDAKGHTILYVGEISKKTFFHELSHLFTEAYKYIDENTLVHKTLALACPIRVDEKSVKIEYAYNGVLEGTTELFAFTIDDRDLDKSGYKNFVSSVQYYLSLLDTDIYSLEEKGIVFFVNNLAHKDVNLKNDLCEMDEEFWRVLKKI